MWLEWQVEGFHDTMIPLPGDAQGYVVMPAQQGLGQGAPQYVDTAAFMQQQPPQQHQLPEGFGLQAPFQAPTLQPPMQQFPGDLAQLHLGSAGATCLLTLHRRLVSSCIDPIRKHATFFLPRCPWFRCHVVVPVVLHYTLLFMLMKCKVIVKGER